MRAPLWIVFCLLAACARAPSPEAQEADASRASDQSAAAGAASASMSEDGAPNLELERYLASEGQDIEACFAGLPPLERDPATASFEGKEGLPAANAGRLVLAIDASGSMAGKAGGITKMQAAKDAASAFLSGLPKDVSVGLVAFGHRGSNLESDKPASCAGVETLYPLGVVDRARIDTALQGFDATGWTPLASAIEQAGRALGPAIDGNTQAIYVVSDGEDTCDEDPVAAARALHEGGAKAIINIIGFDLAAADRAQLKAVADAGGGTFIEVSASRAASLADEMRRGNHNFLEHLRASNANFGKALRNDNRTSGANLKLANCVSKHRLSEQNRAFAWSREQNLGERNAEQAFKAGLKARHAAYAARVDAYTRAADTARDDVNAGLQSAQDRIDHDAEAKR